MYDASFVALAEGNSAVFVTADERLVGEAVRKARSGRKWTRPPQPSYTGVESTSIPGDENRPMFRAQAPGFVPLTLRPVRWLAPASVALFAPVAAQAAGGALEIFPDKGIFIQVLLFALLIMPINKFLFQPVMRVLEERREQIEGARARAEAMQSDANAVLAKYETAVLGAREEVENERKARVESARDERARLTSQARSGAEEQVTKARSDVASALDDARNQLRTEATELAREAASRVLGRELS